jgi:hypothetical protein
MRPVMTRIPVVSQGRDSAVTAVVDEGEKVAATGVGLEPCTVSPETDNDTR